MKSVLDGRAKAKFVQLYLDQATTPALGGAINEAVATLYAGTGHARVGRRGHQRRRQE